MLRINLLPAYVAQRRITRTLLAAYVVAIAAVVVVLGVWYIALSSADVSAKAQADAADRAKSVVDGINAQATSATAALAPIKSDLDFVNAVKAYNVSYIKIFQTVANYTSPKILYNSMELKDTTLAISGYTPSMADLGRYLLEMYKEPDASAVALTSPIPGYEAANPDAPETESVPAGVVGKLPGYPGPVYSYTVDRGKIVAINQGGTAGQGGMGGRQFGAFNQGGRQFGAFNQGGVQSGRNAADEFNPRKDGFPFTVELTLKTAPTRPTPPTTPVVVEVGGSGGGQFGRRGGFGGFGERGGPPMGMFGPGGHGGPPPGMFGPGGPGGGPPPGMPRPPGGRP